MRAPFAVALCGFMIAGMSAAAERAGAGDGSGQDAVVTVGGAGVVRPARPAVARAAADKAITTWLEETVAGGRASPPLLRRNRTGASAPKTGGALTGGRPMTKAVGLLWPLLSVLVLIALATYTVRRWLSRSSQFGVRGVIHVLARHHLSPKQSLCLVQLGQRLLLIGVTPERISAVAEIDGSAETAAILASVQQTRPGSFTSVFARLSEKDVGKEAGEEPIEGGATIAGRQLARTGACVRDLIGRIRGLTGSSAGFRGEEASAEPT